MIALCALLTTVFAAAPAPGKSSNPHLPAVLRHLDAGAIDSAAAELVKARAWKKSSPADEVQLLLAEGRIAAEQGRRDDAIGAFKRALTADAAAELPASAPPRVRLLLALAKEQLAAASAPVAEERQPTEELPPPTIDLTPLKKPEAVAQRTTWPSVYLGGAADPLHRVVGGQVSLGLDLSKWTLAVGATVARFPGFRVWAGRRLVDWSLLAVGARARGLVAPTTGALVAGGGADVFARLHLTGWLDVQASLAGELYGTRVGPTFVPLVEMGLRAYY